MSNNETREYIVRKSIFLAAAGRYAKRGTILTLQASEAARLGKAVEEKPKPKPAPKPVISEAKAKEEEK